MERSDVGRSPGDSQSAQEISAHLSTLPFAREAAVPRPASNVTDPRAADSSRFRSFPALLERLARPPTGMHGRRATGSPFLDPGNRELGRHRVIEAKCIGLSASFGDGRLGRLQNGPHRAGTQARHPAMAENMIEKGPTRAAERQMTRSRCSRRMASLGGSMVLTANDPYEYPSVVTRCRPSLAHRHREDLVGGLDASAAASVRDPRSAHTVAIPLSR
jgi:hypothetical protein